MVFVPISDENPLRSIKFQWVTVAIILINVAVWAAFQLPDMLSSDSCHSFLFATTFGLVPIELRGIDQVLLDGCPVATGLLAHVPEPFTAITYMFLHGDFWHLAFNMLFLWVFGDNVEDALGHIRYVVFYVLCGLAGAGLHTVLNPDSAVPLIGASAAISGVIAAYLMLHPKVHLWVLLFRFIPVRLYAFIVLGLWIAMNIYYAFFGDKAQQIAWLAHIGGLAAGALLIIVMRRRGVPLFDNTSFRQE